MSDAILTLAAVYGLLVLSQLSPGPDVFFVFRTALSQGFRGGTAVAAGISLGFLIQTLVVCSVGSWVMHQDWARWVLMAASCWLLYLAWKIFPRHRGGLTDELDSGRGNAATETLASLAWQGFLCNILNPKCMLFICGLSLGPIDAWGAAYPWFTPSLVVGMTASGQLGWMLWSGLLQWNPIKCFYMKHTARIDAVFSVLLAVFAVLLLVD